MSLNLVTPKSDQVIFLVNGVSQMRQDFSIERVTISNSFSTPPLKNYFDMETAIRASIITYGGGGGGVGLKESLQTDG